MSRIKFNGNDKIKEIIRNSENSEEFKIDFKEIDYYFTNNIIKVKDAYIIEKFDEKTPISYIETNFDKIISFNGDVTGYECSINEITIFDMNTISKEQQYLLGIKIMENYMTKINFPTPAIFYFMYDGESLTIKFHKYRSNEGLLVSNDLNNYEEPTGYFSIDE